MHVRKSAVYNNINVISAEKLTVIGIYIASPLFFCTDSAFLKCVNHSNNIVFCVQGAFKKCAVYITAASALSYNCNISLFHTLILLTRFNNFYKFNDAFFACLVSTK